jgi:hypothetical protein
MTAWETLSPALKDIAVTQSKIGEVERRLFDLADERIRLMDNSGINMQVLSLTTPGVQSLDPDKAVSLARASNDILAETVSGRPDRFQGFATLPTPVPDEAARELERATRKLGLHGAILYGRTRERNLDHPDFLPVFETAAALHAPLYLHPQSPLPAIRNAYYHGFGDKLDAMLATAGIGWHYETGIQALRLVLSGVFDRFPNLQLVLGHWGEVVLFFLERIDLLSKEANLGTGLQRPISSYFKTNISVTPSGLLSQRYLAWAREVLGVERILFSIDYPYHLAPNGGARRFLEEADLSDVEREGVAHANWERMCAAIRR